MYMYAVLKYIKYTYIESKNSTIINSLKLIDISDVRQQWSMHVFSIYFRIQGTPLTFQQNLM